MVGKSMNIIRVRSIAGIFILTLMSGCVGYSYPYGSYGYGNYQANQGYGARYPGQAQHGNYGYRNYQQYQPHRENGEYREHGYNRGGGDYGQYRQHDND
jgi:hypothetical protein